MIKFIYTSLLLTTCFFANAQNNESSTTKTAKQFYTEAGGPGILFSANLDSRFKPYSNTGWGFRVGLGFTLVDDEQQIVQPGGQVNYNYRTRSIATVPVGINYLFGKSGSPNMFEVGAGVTALSRKASILNYNDYKEGYILGHFDFMYRRQPTNGGFSWRIGFTPIINPDGDIVPFGALGIGYAFK
ncbi:MAG: hypothetical protein H0X70_10420 [Segetibacter sp.]|nr:hypothetical protein [Segetibacter sp.]